MPEIPISGSNTLNPALLALKPRQVVLQSRLDMKHSPTHGSSDKAPILNPDQKVLLLKSVARFLERNGFSKTLKKFRSEAEIEVGIWRCCFFCPRNRGTYFECGTRNSYCHLHCSFLGAYQSQLSDGKIFFFFFLNFVLIDVTQF